MATTIANEWLPQPCMNSSHVKFCKPIKAVLVYF